MSTIDAVIPSPAVDIESFLAVRPRLFGIAYRILGSAAEADEVVQDTWIRWHGAERGTIRDATAFLATIATRLAINVSQSARQRRETQMGPWVLEPVDAEADPALRALRGDALEHGVEALLEKLAPVERAVFVLREGFDYPYGVVARVLGLSEPNTRQLASRARRHLAGDRRFPLDASEHRRLLDAVVAAAQSGQLRALEQLLLADIRARSTGAQSGARADACPHTGDQGLDRCVALTRTSTLRRRLPA